MGTELVRPDDIEAADSEDLVAALLLANGARIDERNDKRARKQWVSEQHDQIRDRYQAKARAVYETLWEQCEKSEAGHDYQNYDAKGRTVLVCETCGHTGHRGRKTDTPDSTYGDVVGAADNMNKTMIRSLRDKMIALDEEAGSLVWPTSDDYEPPSSNGNGRSLWPHRSAPRLSFLRQEK